jgi:hypothetical protein
MLLALDGLEAPGAGRHVGDQQAHGVASEVDGGDAYARR